MGGSLAKRWNERDGGANGTWKVSECIEGIDQITWGTMWQRREGRGWIFFVISIARWNQMHTESVPSSNELITINWEDKWHKIIVLVLGCIFDAAVDSEIPRKEVNPSTNFEGEGVNL